MRGSGRLRASARRLWPALLLLTMCAGFADSGGRVRVLLLEAPGSIRVAGRVLAPGPDGIYDAGRSLGTRWHVEGRGPHQVEGFRVRGSVEVVRTAEGLRVLNRVPLEDYVAGTLGSEIYATWEFETFKAQAVVARTYALHQRAARAAEPFDVRAGTGDQMYGGLAAEQGAARAAVDATRGEVLVYAGAPILAAYHSASGGQTASAEEVWGREVPYLVSRPVENEEDSPDTYWRASVSGTTLGRALEPHGLSLGVVRRVRIVDHSASGRVLTVHLEGTKGSGSLGARALRSALGASVIRSTLFEVREVEQAFIFVGSGHGHGVGMSQWGAQAMARRGADYREILAWFYPGTELSRSGSR